MIEGFSILLIGLGVFYAALLGRLALGFRRVLREQPEPQKPAAAPFVSVIIAARNEETSIADCLHSVLQGDYPHDRFEAIVVDDGSTDETAPVVRRLQQRYNRTPAEAGNGPAEQPSKRLRLLRRSQASGGHKQAALAHGIAEARGAVICTTDADCTVRPGWLSAMTGALTPGTAFVAGPVRYRPGGSVFGKMQALEFLGLQAFGAGSIGAGRPTICNSANVAYRRELFETHRGAADAGAATDELLLQHVAYETDQRVRFCAAREAIVETDPSPTLRAFLRQRRRWASMAPRYRSTAVVAAVATLYSFYVLLLVVFGALAFVPSLVSPFLIALTLKLGAEALLLAPACRFFDEPWGLRFLLPTQLLHVPYAVYVGAAGLLGSVRWKGRTLF